jgi:acyl carrier protein
MNEAAVWATCSRVFRELFDNDLLVIAPDTTAADVEGWDSIRHVELIFCLERAFGIRFRTGEMARLKNVGEMVDLIARRAS